MSWLDRHRMTLGLALAVAAALLATTAQATDAATIARQGNGNGAAPCMACHGTDGGGQASAGNPRLAGLNAAYLQKQLDDFADGTRVSPEMQPTAKALSEDERHAMALYYSQLPLPPALAKPVGPPAVADAEGVGEQLALRGRWSRNVPGCVQCHGPGGVGVGAHFPPLAGQPAAYIAAQLKAWQQGRRRNDPLQLMQHLAGALSAGDIEAVAAWFAAQPLPAKGTTP